MREKMKKERELAKSIVKEKNLNSYEEERRRKMEE